MVATDGSELVKRAVYTAIEISKLIEAKLFAVHVITLEGNSIFHSTPIFVSCLCSTKKSTILHQNLMINTVFLKNMSLKMFNSWNIKFLISN